MIITTPYIPIPQSTTGETLTLTELLNKYRTGIIILLTINLIALLIGWIITIKNK